MLNAYLFVFVASFISLFIMRKIAKRIGLVDQPNARKLHHGAIPLVGGISIFSTLVVTFLIFMPMSNNLTIYLGCSAVLIIVGVLDDYYDVSFKVRLFVQAGISLAMMLLGKHSLHNLGFLMGSETISLSVVSGAIVTILAVIGAINAFNMVDGIDGLLGGLSSVTFGSLGIVFYASGNFYLAHICLLIVAATIPYIMLNLGCPLGKRFKVFMGDAGSMFIGFSVVWMLVRGTQDPAVISFKPVTALWLIAIPLMDMATIMIRRVRKGHSPFRPDREHLHHICQRFGMSPHISLLFICSLATICAAIGILSDLGNVPESVMFISFVAMFICYFLIMNNISKVILLLKRLLGYPVATDANTVTSAEVKATNNHISH